jgi:DNA-binding MarR family transcriptional regulator
MSKQPSSRASQEVPFARRFGYRFNRIADALAQQTLLYARRELGLNLAEYRIISVLWQSDALSIREIAEHTQLDKAHATRALTDLIDRGLATRVVDAQDRRLRVVRLTPAGRSMASASGPFTRERQDRLEACVSAADFRVFDKALALMTAEVERMLAEEMNKGSERRSARG